MKSLILVLTLLNILVIHVTDVFQLTGPNFVDIITPPPSNAACQIVFPKSDAEL